MFLLSALFSTYQKRAKRKGHMTYLSLRHKTIARIEAIITAEPAKIKAVGMLRDGGWEDSGDGIGAILTCLSLYNIRGLCSFYMPRENCLSPEITDLPSVKANQLICSMIETDVQIALTYQFEDSLGDIDMPMYTRLAMLSNFQFSITNTSV